MSLLDFICVIFTLKLAERKFYVSLSVLGCVGQVGLCQFHRVMYITVLVIIGKDDAFTSFQASFIEEKVCSNTSFDHEVLLIWKIPSD